MGTNFYIAQSKNEKADYSYERHIGKRSASGFYCWDCRQTFCKDGEAQIHHSKTRRSLWSDARDTEWFDFCPSCGAKQPDASLTDSSMGLELGFRKQETEKIPTGVHSVCSFTWAKYPNELQDIKFVRDEYGEVISFEEFRKMLKVECPIQYFDAIGEEFS